ncbi:MAG: 2-oxoacid:acceptor oxidoreductase family protein [Gammaproteobacteria bacterium]|nr:2-oxoacid:acceptor oxidoreductase family protein [Gammaproteobacteria bacterium]
MSLFEVRIHGRGGQGVVSAAEMLSVAVFTEGNHAQAIPSFGSERMGAPVQSFVRFSDIDIRTREPVIEPDCLIIQDVTLLSHDSTFAGLKEGGYVLINSTHTIEELGIADKLKKIPPEHLMVVNATGLAREHLGRPIPNAALIGGFSAITGQLKIESIEEAIHKKFAGPVGDGNVAAARAAYNEVLKAKGLN